MSKLFGAFDPLNECWSMHVALPDAIARAREFFAEIDPSEGWPEQIEHLGVYETEHPGIDLTNVYGNELKWTPLWVLREMPGKEERVDCSGPIGEDGFHSDDCETCEGSGSLNQHGEPWGYSTEFDGVVSYEFPPELPSALFALSFFANRDVRQAQVATWCRDAFGVEEATSLRQRGLRLLEEAVELYQAVDGDLAQAHKLLDFVFSRPKGTVRQELGGVGTTVLALAAAAGVSADFAEACEVNRILSKPISHFSKRNAEKNAAGFRAGGER